MRVVRVLALILVVLPLLIVAGAAVALDPLIRSKLPPGVSEALGVPVELNDADASLSGHVRLERLSIGNPPGYTDPQVLRIEAIEADAKPLSLLSDVVKVGTLRIERPLLSVEFKGLKSNVKALMDQIPPRERKEGGAGKKFLIDRLILDGASVRIASDRLPGGTRTVALPSLELTNVGTAEGAATMGQIASTVLQALLREAIKHAPEMPAELARSLGEAVEGRAREILDDATEGLEERVEEGLRRKAEDLFKRKAE